jgi:hypothetical protein
MKEYHLLVTVLGIGLALTILTLIRRDHIHLRQGLFWTVVAVASLVFGIWPGLIDFLSHAVGIAYSPALLFLAAIVVLILRALFTDIALTQLKRDVRRLNQRIALSVAGRTGQGCRHVMSICNRNSGHQYRRALCEPRITVRIHPLPQRHFVCMITWVECYSIRSNSFWPFCR